ncbi:GNAT family N-acetyltransferase [Nesterenkonia massiliensis]|uniref:GNAT family N-acetyltransferase n=1 Tax=Nesterenkonia massiliensis TaxID=1232429 RepID=A0ABT2HMS5_9MICC|nr:GNAT family N-acetyltransferase [Nesterenkonia massiliensis]
MSIPAPKPPQIAPLPDGLTSRTFPLTLGEDGKPDPAGAAFIRTVEHGFYEDWYSDEKLERLQPALAEDNQQCTGVFVDPGFAALEPWGEALEQIGFDAALHPVGTFVDYDKTLNAGGELLPARLVTGVTVNPGFRRRGILKHMMTTALARAVQDEMPLVALTVSEGSIYGRFGFGATTREQRLEVNVTQAGEAFALRTPATGRVLTVDPAKLGDVVDATFAQFHQRTRGSVERQAFYRQAATAQWNPEDITSQWRKARTIVHITEEGTIGGYAVFTFTGWDNEPHTMQLRDMVTVDAASRIELWRHLADMDLVGRITQNNAPVDDPLAAALVNPRARKVTAQRDVLWVRILDVVRVLQAREWGADGQFVLELSDPLGICAGNFAITVTSGAARVQPAADAAGPRFRTDVETLGALYMGDVSVLTMRDAGRISGPEDADWNSLAATFDLPTAPYCATHF